MKRIITAIALSFAIVAPAFAGSEVPTKQGWGDLTDAGSFKYKHGSFKVEQTKGGKLILTVDVAIYAKGKVEFYSAGIKAEDCAEGRGTVYLWGIDDGEVKTTQTWVSNGGNGTSNLADGLCEVMRRSNGSSQPQSQPQPGRQPQQNYERSNPRAGNWS